LLLIYTICGSRVFNVGNGKAGVVFSAATEKEKGEKEKGEGRKEKGERRKEKRRREKRF